MRRRKRSKSFRRRRSKFRRRRGSVGRRTVRGIKIGNRM